MTLRGYRSSDRHLLTGPWVAGEMLGLPLPEWPALAEPVSVEPPADTRTELCVLPGAGFVRYVEIDWVNRRARVETGLRPGPGPDTDSLAGYPPATLERLLDAVTAHGFRLLNLHRLYGWVTPASRPPTAVLEHAGFRREASIPEAVWLDGRAREREIWGAVRDV